MLLRGGVSGSSVLLVSQAAQARQDARKHRSKQLQQQQARAREQQARAKEQLEARATEEAAIKLKEQEDRK